MAELKPCPFCGGKDTGVLTTSYDGYWYAVFCENCMAHTRKCRKEEDAIEAWNKRTEPERPKGRWEWRGGIPWCTNCGEMPPDYSYGGDANTTQFCPNCGADMRGESE